MLNLARCALFAKVLVALTACDGAGVSPPPSTQSAIAEVSARNVAYPDYPKAGMTYLSFSSAHGFQVNLIGSDGRAWLWYPGNSAGVPELYKLDQINGIQALCWAHPGNTYNPVTQTPGGGYKCEELKLARKTIVSSLRGDPFNLASGRVPYKLDRCSAPQAFDFNRTRFRC
ncbi:hypothetical protein TRL7639_02733 [Falsiruegeria litorea R37]|uniref:Uncharacterized protein n=1 Tax=Falsiruegeria litorea R37 TaxID=1200284 RepID=A0A1Y5SXU3_9RHOB|nr:hypothetical protein [Falsiruegeria litorea]SLN49347.1 hypothetical protein TRL7639_02733 [Falsiruegeria litorea R37]